ncbi:Flp pilus assembly protein CpaB [Trinickia dabaoshanensis]|uniref:Flp pilus assembly protein CpaB n=1 Tax=Trinickia dabaoshanensis TaxID=564714 RepID=A0A2N7VJW1_9BURK|nr:Flp pilus assembly protein CpaB [Trinickia dabaoshanensis]PMS17423.1 Flp pilus assembly protein CpaB [Trinickia dabaoshanensis]
MQNILKLAGLIIVAAIGAVVLRALYVAASRPAPPKPAPTVQIRAAAADLPDGLLLRDSDLVWKSVPRADVPAGALVEGQPAGADLKGDLLRHAVHAGTPLGQADVISPSSPGFLAAALKPGMRAISVAIDDVSGNAGLIEPGDYVDVLLTQQIATASGAPSNPDRTVETETVAERVRVLAVGSAFKRPKDDDTQKSAANTRARTVTFEVTPRSAEVVTVAAHLGSLSLALRSFATRDRHEPQTEDVIEPQSAPVWARDVSRGLRAMAAAAPSAPRGVASHMSSSARPVVVYRGSKQSDSGGSDFSGLPGGGAGLMPPLPSGTPPASPGSMPPPAPSAHPAA